MSSPVFNFTQIDGNKWKVMRRQGGTFNALAYSYDDAVDMFLRWMWGGKDRPDRLSFEEWRKQTEFKFFLT